MEPNQGPADETLMLAVRDGQVGKLSVLFERHHRSVFNFFFRMTSNREQSEDLVQDVFFRMLKYRDSYQDKTSFTAWMYQVARSAHIDSYRKRRNESPWAEDQPEPVSREPMVDERIRKEQEMKLLQQALAALPEDKREVLVLSRYQNLKYQEIGQILGCEENAVKLRVFRAVRMLGQIYSGLAGEKAS
jgi:RNA polymerase sigma-70 factor (ECF subfamily)